MHNYSARQHQLPILENIASILKMPYFPMGSSLWNPYSYDLSGILNPFTIEIFILQNI